VLGHLSRSQIAKSRRQERGTGIAFAGLILGYGQLAIFTILLLGLLGFVGEIRQDLAKHPDTRLALLDRIAHGDPYHVTPQRTARQEQTAIQALHLIQAKEAEYLAAHPDEGYACQMYKLGATVGHDASGQTGLDTLLVQSHYNMTFNRCGRIPGNRSRHEFPAVLHDSLGSEKRRQRSRGPGFLPGPGEWNRAVLERASGRRDCGDCDVAERSMPANRDARGLNRQRSCADGIECPYLLRVRAIS